MTKSIAQAIGEHRLRQLAEMERTDIYSAEVERLTANPWDISRTWGTWGPLFKAVGPRHCAPCLTMVRGGDLARGRGGNPDPELTAAIQADERIPADAGDITVADLPVFAEWQRKIDRLYGRPTPQAKETQT